MKKAALILVAAVLIGGCGGQEQMSPWGVGGGKSEERGGSTSMITSLDAPKWIYAFLMETFDRSSVDKLSCSITVNTGKYESAEFSCSDGTQTRTAVVGPGQPAITKKQSALLALVVSLQMQRHAWSNSSAEGGTVYLEDDSNSFVSYGESTSGSPIIQVSSGDIFFTLGGNEQLTAWGSEVLLKLTKFVMHVTTNFSNFTFEKLQCTTGGPELYDCTCQESESAPQQSAN